MVFTIDWQHLCGVFKNSPAFGHVFQVLIKLYDQKLPFLGMFTYHQAKLRMHVGLGSPEENGGVSRLYLA